MVVHSVPVLQIVRSSNDVGVSELPKFIRPLDAGELHEIFKSIHSCKQAFGDCGCWQTIQSREGHQRGGESRPCSEAGGKEELKREDRGAQP
jgi:hypothetical protein